MQSKFLILLLIFTFFNIPYSYSLSPEIKLSDISQEQRAMNLFLEVRCLVCNGQVIENSDTEFSFEMRKLIRGKIKAGESDVEIKDYLLSEFGKDILTEVGFNGSGMILWLLPIGFGIVLALFLRRKISSTN